MRVQAALCGAFVDATAFRAAFAGPAVDLSMVARYLQIPVEERPNLSVYFDRDYYRAGLDDAPGDTDLLLHFLLAGCAAGKSPHPMIDLAFIDEKYGGALGPSPDANALANFLDRDIGDPSPYFDIDHYRQLAGLAIPSGGALRHYLSEGLQAGRMPNAYLDLAWYIEHHDDLPRDLYDALRHFVTAGDGEGRSPGPQFDGALYRARYPDVAAASVPPLRHFLTSGIHEGRHAAVERSGGAIAAVGDMAVGAPVRIDPGEVSRTYQTLRDRIAAIRDQRKFRSVEPLRLADVSDPKSRLAEIVLPSATDPAISVVIPVFNEFKHTVACLLSISAMLPNHSFEVVLADDGSTDPDMSALANIPHIVIVRQTSNFGFIRICNVALQACRGRYILLLNNDTEVTAGAIDALADVLDADAGIAAAGPKLVYPDGRLQEAGCFVRPNGESRMVGLFGDPGEGGFMRDRDVAYCSGAALMVRRAAIGDVLFDDCYRPAYCEDVDLCLRLNAAGHRIRFVGGATVIHHLSVTANRQSADVKMQRITTNQQILTERWSDLLERMDRIRAIAFYLPQFHTTPENDRWWGAGFTEWTNVVKARPSYVGHYQPHLPADLGFYDLTSPDALRRQATLAARYGIEGFCVYYYNFGARRMLSRPLDVLQAHPDIPLRFCLCWANENWTRNWDGGDRETLIEQDYGADTQASVIEDAVETARDARAITVGGKPLFLVYRPLLIPDPPAFAHACRDAFSRAGFGGVHLAYVESMEAVDQGISPADLGFDACVEFPPHGRAAAAKTPVEVVKPGWAGYRYDYPETIMSFLDRDSTPYVRYPAVFPGWDNTPRQPVAGTSFERCSPEAFRFYVEEKIEEVRQFHMGDQRLLFINAWNEWAEGAHLEPDSGFGHGWLEAWRQAAETSRFT